MIHKPSLESHKKYGPDRFSRFDVYWIQTNRQTPKQTDKPNLNIDERKGNQDLRIEKYERKRKEELRKKN